MPDYVNYQRFKEFVSYAIGHPYDLRTYPY